MTVRQILPKGELMAAIDRWIAEGKCVTIRADEVTVSSKPTEKADPYAAVKLGK